MNAARAGSGSLPIEASSAPRIICLDAHCEVQPSISSVASSLALQPFSAQAAGQEPEVSRLKLQFCAAMADLEVGAPIDLKWAEKLGGVPSDFYWFSNNLYRERPAYYKGKKC